MKRTTEKVSKLTSLDLRYDGNQHTEKLSTYAGSLKEYAELVKNSDVFVKTSAFDRHLKSDPDDIKVLSFSSKDGYLICYVLLYKGSLSPFFISGVQD
jgi:hypothetical protein